MYNFNNVSDDVKKAKKLCGLIKSHISYAPVSANKFAGSAKDFTESVEQWIENNHDVTTNQVVALFNIYRRVKIWNKLRSDASR